MNGQSIRLRPAAAPDVPKLAALEGLCFRSDRLSPQSFRRLAASPTAVVMVAEASARIVGCLIMLFRRGSRVGRIYSLAVHPQCRRKGLASRMIADSENHAARRGATTVRLEVRNDNPGALDFYHQHGYRVLGTHARYYGDGADALRLAKQIVAGKS
jgi:ribosomal protein S18 acetylase RimI-like enzyme